MNPGYIGLSIVDYDANGNEIKVVDSIVYQIGQSTQIDDNKRKHETSQIAKKAFEVIKHYKCSLVAMEDLQIKSKNHGKGRRFNRQINNSWNRRQFIWLIEKRCDANHIRFNKVNCAYSSTIGNILHRDLPDMCASASEIARRGHVKYIKKSSIYPKANFSQIPIICQWKKLGMIDLTTSLDWIEVHNRLRDSNVRVRVTLESFPDSTKTEFCSTKSGVMIYRDFY